MYCAEGGEELESGSVIRNQLQGRNVEFLSFRSAEDPLDSKHLPERKRPKREKNDVHDVDRAGKPNQTNPRGELRRSERGIVPSSPDRTVKRNEEPAPDSGEEGTA